MELNLSNFKHLGPGTEIFDVIKDKLVARRFLEEYYFGSFHGRHDMICRDCFERAALLRSANDVTFEMLWKVCSRWWEFFFERTLHKAAGFWQTQEFTIGLNRTYAFLEILEREVAVSNFKSLVHQGSLLARSMELLEANKTDLIRWGGYDALERKAKNDKKKLLELSKPFAQELRCYFIEETLERLQTASAYETGAPSKLFEDIFPRDPAKPIRWFLYYLPEDSIGHAFYALNENTPYALVPDSFFCLEEGLWNTNHQEIYLRYALEVPQDFTLTPMMTEILEKIHDPGENLPLLPLEKALELTKCL